MDMPGDRYFQPEIETMPGPSWQSCRPSAFSAFWPKGMLKPLLLASAESDDYACAAWPREK